MINHDHELKLMVEARMVAALTKRSREVLAEAFDDLAREHAGYPLSACVHTISATWIRELSMEQVHTQIRLLTAALDQGNFESVAHLEAIRTLRFADRYKRAKSEDRLLALRWSAWLGYEVKNVYKVLGRALYGMEAA